MQELFQYPGLDVRNSALDENYAIDLYLQNVAPLIQQHRLQQGSLSTNVLKLDANFKVCILLV